MDALRMPAASPAPEAGPPSVPDRLKEWSTTEEVAAWLGISVRTLYYYNSRGEGPARHRLTKRIGTGQGTSKIGWPHGLAA